MQPACEEILSPPAFRHRLAPALLCHLTAIGRDARAPNLYCPRCTAFSTSRHYHLRPPSKLSSVVARLTSRDHLQYVRHPRNLLPLPVDNERSVHPQASPRQLTVLQHAWSFEERPASASTIIVTFAWELSMETSSLRSSYLIPGLVPVSGQVWHPVIHPSPEFRCFACSGGSLVCFIFSSSCKWPLLKQLCRLEPLVLTCCGFWGLSCRRPSLPTHTCRFYHCQASRAGRTIEATPQMLTWSSTA